MKKITKIAMLVLAVVMCLSVFASCGSKSYTKDNTKFVIGCSGPLTGGAAVYGLGVQNGAQLAVDEINAAGGIDGILIDFRILDDKHDASNVQTNYSTLFEGGMQVALGCVTTGPCKEFKALSKEDNLFFLTPSASANEIVEFENAYQMCFADGNQGTVAAKYVNENCKDKKIGVLYRADDAYSTGILKQFKESIDTSLSIVETSFTGDVVTSFASQINTLKDCSFIFMPIYCAPAAQFMTEAKNDIAADATYYGCDGLDGIDTSVEGFDIKTIPQEVSFLSHFNSKATEGPAKAFIDKYTAEYGADTLNQFGASAYDCIYAIADALKQAKKDGKITVTSTPEEICNALKGIFQGGYTFSGVTGENIKWDAQGYVSKAAIKYIIKEAD